jgi:hypothetical protein
VVGARFPALFQTLPGAQPASYTIGTGSLPEEQRPGRGVGHPSPSSAEVKEREELHYYSPSGPSRKVIYTIYIYVYIVTFFFHGTMFIMGSTEKQSNFTIQGNRHQDPFKSPHEKVFH